MLIGAYRHTMDAKGRVVLPASFRELLAPSFVITKGLDRCLSLYSEEAWQNLTEQLNCLPVTRPEARALLRFVLASAQRLEMDRQGRFLVPSGLRAYAALSREIVINGALRCVEVWERSRWDDYEKRIEPMVVEAAETLTGFWT